MATDLVTDVNLVKKHILKSVIWSYFGIRVDNMGKPIDDSEKKPVCRTCSKEVPCKDIKDANTSMCLLTFGTYILCCIKKL